MFVPSPDAALGDGDGAARHPYQLRKSGSISRARQLLLGQILARPIQRFKNHEQTVGVGSRFGPSLKFPDGAGHVRAGNEVRLHVEIDPISARADFMVLGVGGQALRHLPSEFRDLW